MHLNFLEILTVLLVSFPSLRSKGDDLGERMKFRWHPALILVLSPFFRFRKTCSTNQFYMRTSSWIKTQSWTFQRAFSCRCKSIFFACMSPSFKSQYPVYFSNAIGLLRFVSKATCWGNWNILELTSSYEVDNGCDDVMSLLYGVVIRSTPRKHKNVGTSGIVDLSINQKSRWPQFVTSLYSLNTGANSKHILLTMHFLRTTLKG